MGLRVTGLYKDVRFWLVLLFVVRLYHITLPPLEFQHPWRQTDGLMIARNFYETDNNIFYPRVDIAGGDKTGITGSEFPVLNYLIYLVSLVFGYNHWYGRLIVLIISTFGSLYFFKVLKKYFGETVAFNSTIILTASYWFSYSRKIFPDCFAAALCIIALYYVLEYLEHGKPLHLILYLLLGSIGGLSKISSLTLLSVLIVPIISSQFQLKRKIWVSFASTITLFTVIGWYFFWVPYLNETYGYGDHFTMGCSFFSMGWQEIITRWKEVLPRLYIVPLKYLGFGVFISSLLYALIKRKWLTLTIFLIPYFFFLLVILKTGSSIISDQYYILVGIPPMAFIAGYGLGQLPNKILMLMILFGVAGENIGDQVYDFRTHKINSGFSDLEEIVDSVSNRTDLFVINSGPHCPTAMYFAHRKGWTVSSPQLLEHELIASLKSRGCQYILICKKFYGLDNDLVLALPQLYEDEFYRVYKIPDSVE